MATSRYYMLRNTREKTSNGYETRFKTTHDRKRAAKARTKRPSQSSAIAQPAVDSGDARPSTASETKDHLTALPTELLTNILVMTASTLPRGHTRKDSSEKVAGERAFGTNTSLVCRKFRDLGITAYYEERVDNQYLFLVDGPSGHLEWAPSNTAYVLRKSFRAHATSLRLRICKDFGGPDKIVHNYLGQIREILHPCEKLSYVFIRAVYGSDRHLQVVEDVAEAIRADVHSGLTKTKIKVQLELQGLSVDHHIG